MNKYELLYIIDNELEAEAKDALIAKFSDIVVNDGGNMATPGMYSIRLSIRFPTLPVRKASY